MKLVNMPEPDHRSFDERVRLSKDEAKAAGVTTYWTGIACHKGHLSHRYVIGDECVICKRNYNKSAAQKRNKARLEKDAASVGISPDVRRAAEELRDRMRLERELSKGWFE